MFYPFLVADLRSGLHYRPNDITLADVALAPKSAAWQLGREIAGNPDPVWAYSAANAPVETIAAVTRALEDLVLATPDLRLPAHNTLPDSRARRHFEALIGLWQRMGDGLPEGLAPVRHILELPQGRFLTPMPVVEGSLDPLAPASMRALYARLQGEFGSVPAAPNQRKAKAGTRLHALQGGVAASQIEMGPMDDSIDFYGLRDPASCADFAAALARRKIEAGVAARDIAVICGGSVGQLARAFAAQGVPLSGLEAAPPQRDLVGEAALHLALAKRPPTPAMVLASLALSPLMPWPAQIGRDLAESVMGGDFRGRVLGPNADHAALWADIRSSASSLAQLRFLMERICTGLTKGDEILARLSLPMGEGSPDWEAILRSIQVQPPRRSDPDRNLEGVSLWPAHETPWRDCRHLIVADFTDGLYPARPRANPLFLDSEIALIHQATSLQLQGREAGLAYGLARFDEALQAVSGSVIFLVPWRDLAGGRLSPSAGLSLVARAIDGVGDAADLIIDIAKLSPSDWPVDHHFIDPAAEPLPPPKELTFNGRDLLALRRNDEGAAKPQSPSRLETLLVSPLAWLLGELDAKAMEWGPEALDVMAKGNIAHDVFEHVFPAGDTLPTPEDLPDAVAAAYDTALNRHAPYLRSASWEMERSGLQREILKSAQGWLSHMQAIGAKVFGNELWLAGEAHGIRLHGKADAILELADGRLVVVDHKKSGSKGRRARMEAGWDLQAGLYRDMIARPIRKAPKGEPDGMDSLTGKSVSIAYHLMNDGGLLTSGLALTDGWPARDMGDAVNEGAITKLKERLAELGAGRIVMNTEADYDFFTKEAAFTPYALEDSPIVSAFILPAETEE